MKPRASIPAGPRFEDWVLEEGDYWAPIPPVEDNPLLPFKALLDLPRVVFDPTVWTAAWPGTGSNAENCAIPQEKGRTH